MNKRRLIEGALALLALACAALLIAFARGVATVENEVAALESPAVRITLAGDADLPEFGPADRLAQTLLSSEGDIEFRRALGLIELSRQFDHIPNQVLELHAQAIALLQRLDRDPRERASRASAMIGALYVEDLVIDPEAELRYRQQATEAFQTAIRLDSTNEAAKLGLELILRSTPASTLQVGEEGSGGGVTGAGESPPGTGY
jgi:hypothetical protein